MDDLISRKALRGKLDALSEIFRRRGENEDKGFLAVQCGVMFADCEVRDAPAVDAVEVVRCCECKHAYPIPPGKARLIYADRALACKCWRGDYDITSDLSLTWIDGYCDEGERRMDTKEDAE